MSTRRHRHIQIRPLSSELNKRQSIRAWHCYLRDALTITPNERILLGLPEEFMSFRHWIETQFYDHPKTGEHMTWKHRCKVKHGRGWDLDHEPPLCYYDLCKALDVTAARCFLTVQPLWRIDHVQKTRLENWNREKGAGGKRLR